MEKNSSRPAANSLVALRDRVGRQLVEAESRTRHSSRIDIQARMSAIRARVAA